MCGIVGILGADAPESARAMAERVAHRGPDGAGTWSDRHVTLGHRRLAILDVAHGDQPMTDPTGRYTIVYNGECYNHQGLRAELEAAGARFATHTDTETVLQGYAYWGPDVVARMEGMFAFALWDAQERHLFVARDPWGVKPFFHTFVDGDWIFASEQKALYGHPGFVAAPDEDRIKERAVLEFLTGQATLLGGVHQLPPGTWAHVRPGDRAIRWHLYYHVPSEWWQDPGSAARAVRERFTSAVRDQLHSDVPLGVILSGGLDSAAVAAVHRSLSDTPLQTFTVADSEEVEDVQAARRMAEHLGSDHHEWFHGPDDMWNGMPAWTWHNESINFTEFFFQPLFAHTRDHVKVALCGQGSDELWGGYPRYQDPGRLAETRLERLHRARPRHADDLASLVAMTHPSGASLAEWDQQGQLANFQLRLVDRTSMAHGLEVRVPFLSRPLHAASRGIPWAWKVRDGVEKWILRKALEDVGIPRDLVWRRKVPAGRATTPAAVAAFEEEAARLVDASAMDRHPLGRAFATAAEFLVYRLWEETFIHRQGRPVQHLEDVA